MPQSRGPGAAESRHGEDGGGHLGVEEAAGQRPEAGSAVPHPGGAEAADEYRDKRRTVRHADERREHGRGNASNGSPIEGFPCCFGSPAPSTLRRTVA